MYWMSCNESCPWLGRRKISAKLCPRPVEWRDESMPANAANVGRMSRLLTIVRSTRPGSMTPGHHAMAGTRSPPSYGVHFSPVQQTIIHLTAANHHYAHIYIRWWLDWHRVTVKGSSVATLTAQVDVRAVVWDEENERVVVEMLMTQRRLHLPHHPRHLVQLVTIDACRTQHADLCHIKQTD